MLPRPGPEGQATPVLRHGDTVLRPAGPWTPAVHALLNHLENAGFTGSPRVVGNGYDGDGREVLTYIPGGFVHPHAWSDGLAPLAFPQRRPRRHHQSPRHRTWNIVARDGLPVAFIDWPTAGPTGRLDEIAATAWLNAQLHDDDVAERQNL